MVQGVLAELGIEMKQQLAAQTGTLAAPAQRVAVGEAVGATAGGGAAAAGPSGPAGRCRGRPAHAGPTYLSPFLGSFLQGAPRMTTCSTASTTSARPRTGPISQHSRTPVFAGIAVIQSLVAIAHAGKRVGHRLGESTIGRSQRWAPLGSPVYACCMCCRSQSHTQEAGLEPFGGISSLGARDSSGLLWSFDAHVGPQSLFLPPPSCRYLGSNP